MPQPTWFLHVRETFVASNWTIYLRNTHKQWPNMAQNFRSWAENNSKPRMGCILSGFHPSSPNGCKEPYPQFLFWLQEG